MISQRYSVRDASKMLGVGVKALRYWSQAGHAPAIRASDDTYSAAEIREIKRLIKTNGLKNIKPPAPEETPSEN